mgnify:CR=1 FL=1
MPVRNYLTDPKQLLAQGQMIVSSTEDSRFQHRVECVNLVLGGMMPSELSRYVAESKNTITMWVKTADERGFDALHVRKQPGRPTKLSREQLEELERILKEDEPSMHGYRVWDGSSVSSLVSKRYGVSLSARQCQRMFRGFGMSLVGPQTYPSLGECNGQERKEFKKN